MEHQKKNIKKKIYRLRKELLKYNYQYYTLDTSHVSDYDFDKKLRELSLLEKEHPELYDPTSPTIRIGEIIYKKNNRSTIIRHGYKMYSLQNTYFKKELMDWIKKIHKYSSSSFVCELKYDGVSINLIYKNGFLIHAVTRGDGKKGENVTANVRTIQSIPIKLSGENHPTDLEIRGEIFISIKKFIKINTERKKQGKKPYSNPRNTASGIIKIKDTKEVDKRNLSCIVYSVIGKNLPFDTQYQSLKYLQKWGFKVPEYAVLCKREKDIFHFMNYWNRWKHLLPYHIDGIVIKVNEYQKQTLLGYTNKYPRWAIAYKFRQKKLSETKLLNLKFQVGRTGIITPVAHVIPTKITGTIVKRVSLYNNRFIQKMNLHYGDYLLLEKGGDVIPKVTKVNVKKRLMNATPIDFIKACPSCHSFLIKEKELFYCKNRKCPSQIKEKIQHFVSAMNIQSIGKKIINRLYKNGFLYSIYDLYRLKKEEIIKIDGVKEKLADSMIKNIEQSKNHSYHRVLYGLGIPHVGEQMAKRLTEIFTNVKDLMNADSNILTSISGIGKKIANSIKTYFSIIENKTMVERLIEQGLNFYKKSSRIKSMIEGKSFVFTGKLSCMTRHTAKNMIELLGGRVFNTVNNKINFIVVGKNFGSKLEKGMNKNNVQILNEDVFIDLIEKAKKEIKL
ncbi:MAG: NAD-dependent DNA ligase LigA [Flavobacteriales bacterium]|jgi:DNA ligase (NAD+)|uniref:NAD-dependent DNA ligase LigA n=1 Tax=Blattabacterium sp. (Mastotermes darwiniensis) TaxID=39768 RepID=UPI000231DF6C|nr:NAD-dependent DNA ligase LigA [Blattabacterium sp. (Mastotermes darwiniensis)]AER40388.1 DNA ligase [Blattabacterium sp. (Mastotermes darwiniensis) str. MADAR]MDR1804891.1 NAD-dependent DNA ligase LigA [Flavobacteriales bacterium]